MLSACNFLYLTVFILVNQKIPNWPIIIARDVHTKLEGLFGLNLCIYIYLNLSNGRLKIIGNSVVLKGTILISTIYFIIYHFILFILG